MLGFVDRPLKLKSIHALLQRFVVLDRHEDGDPPTVPRNTTGLPVSCTWPTISAPFDFRSDIGRRSWLAFS
jgi:hypothetical protein